MFIYWEGKAKLTMGTQSSAKKYKTKWNYHLFYVILGFQWMKPGLTAQLGRNNMSTKITNRKNKENIMY